MAFAPCFMKRIAFTELAKYLNIHYREESSFPFDKLFAYFITKEKLTKRKTNRIHISDKMSSISKAKYIKNL